MEQAKKKAKKKVEPRISVVEEKEEEKEEKKSLENKVPETTIAQEAPKVVTEITTQPVGPQPQAFGQTPESESVSQIQPQPHLVQQNVENPVELDEELEGGSKSRKILKIILIVILSMAFVAVVSGGVYTYLKGVQKTETSTTKPPTPTSQPQEEVETPTQTPKPEIDLSILKVNVLNGSGTPGEAVKVKALLEKAGFTVGSTGNAKSYDFTDTVIRTKEDVTESVVATLKKTLGEIYSVKVGDSLDKKDTYDIIVSVGSKKG